MAIEFGKTYKDRTGRMYKVTSPEEILEAHREEYGENSHAELETFTLKGRKFLALQMGSWGWNRYYSNGRIYTNKETDFDLVEEVTNA